MGGAKKPSTTGHAAVQNHLLLPILDTPLPAALTGSRRLTSSPPGPLPSLLKPPPQRRARDPDRLRHGLQLMPLVEHRESRPQVQLGLRPPTVLPGSPETEEQEAPKELLTPRLRPDRLSA